MRPLIALSTFAIALAACTTTGAQPANTGMITVADGASVQLAPGQSAMLTDNSRIDYLKLLNDSRCRPDVECVWAGDATIALRWTPPTGAAQGFELHTTLKPKSFDAGSHTVSLHSLERGTAPRATLLVDIKR